MVFGMCVGRVGRTQQGRGSPSSSLPSSFASRPTLPLIELLGELSPGQGTVGKLVQKNAR